MKNGLWAEEVDEGAARRVADIVGPSSAAKRALEQLAARRLAGEDVVLLKSGRMFFVAPRSQVTNVSRVKSLNPHKDARNEPRADHVRLRSLCRQ